MVKAEKARIKDWEANSVQIILSTAAKEAEQVVGEGVRDENFHNLWKQAQDKYLGKKERSALKMSYVSQPAVDKFREILRPIIIRRTADSKDLSGEPILALPPIRRVIAWSQMRDYERAQMDDINQMQLRWKKLAAKCVSNCCTARLWLIMLVCLLGKQLSWG